jgi:thymidylate synthase (FAD)
MKVELLSITPNAEELIETAARTCYQSEPKGEVGDLIKRLLKANPPHESVLEHASATFRFGEVSRAFTHQLVRHRLCAFSQQSQRYVKESQFDYVIPDDIISRRLFNPNDTTDYISKYKDDMQMIQKLYNYWKEMGLKNEDARFVLPNACHTEIVMTANLRQWRHVISMRCDKHAQWEIQNGCKEVLRILHLNVPNVFEDLKLKFIG